jgi:hypothetical protein
LWIFNRDGFASITQHRDNPDLLIVKTRVKGDLAKMFGAGHRLIEAGSDYAFRALVNRSDVAHGSVRMVAEIDERNFKQTVTDKRRMPYYFQIWETLCDMQDAFAQSPPPKSIV